MAKTIFLKDGSARLLFGTRPEKSRQEFAALLRDTLGDDAEKEFLRQMETLDDKCWDCVLCDPDKCTELKNVKRESSRLENKLNAVKQERNAALERIEKYETTIKTLSGLLYALSKHVQPNSNAAKLLQACQIIDDI